jgi:hypothetical protein
VGYRFTLVLSREVTEEETAILREAGCACAVFGTDSLPTNAAVTVSKMDFDDTMSASLEAAIESGLEAVKKVPELSVPGLTVPAQPAHASEDSPAEGSGKVIAGSVIAEPPEDIAEPAEPAQKKAPARKPAAKRSSSRKADPEQAAAVSAAG